MPRGQPDYGVYQEQYAIAGMADLGEAVARLHGINVFDRRGFTIWQDDFELPSLRWTGAIVATGQLPILSTVTAFSGIQSALLNVPLGITPQSEMRRRFPLIRRGRIGIEFWVQGFTITPGLLVARFDIYDGAIPASAELQYDTNARTITIWSGGVGVPVATNVYMTDLYHYFLPIKLVIDMDTDHYIRLLVGETEYDLTPYPLVPLAGSPNKYSQAIFRVIGSDAFDMWMYIDNFILTQNEP